MESNNGTFKLKGGTLKSRSYFLWSNEVELILHAIEI